ncbi:MAG: hypothetical protein IJ746_08100 [Ruminococcus sp.]|nr:hypothetical protein [Ruminococcus sp.]
MTIFIGGSRSVAALPSGVIDRLQNIISQNFDIIIVIGDADGADLSVQRYLQSVNYQAVTVYASNGKARNNAGGWQVKSIPVSKDVSGYAFYAAKDKAMAADADYGFMIWDGRSRGTRENINNLTKLGKNTLVFDTRDESFKVIKG